MDDTFRFLREIRKSIVAHETTEIATGALALITTFREHLDGWLHEIVAPIAQLIDNPETHIDVRAAAVQCFVDIGHFASLRDYSVALFHPLARALASTPELQPQTMNLLETLLLHMGPNYQRFGFVKIIGDIMVRHKIQAEG